MKTITSIFLFFLTTTLYSQNLNDSVKFDSLNKSLICDNLMDLVRETRLKNGSAEIEKEELRWPALALSARIARRPCAIRPGHGANTGRRVSMRRFFRFIASMTSRDVSPMVA